MSFHSHSPESQLQKLVALLKEGKNLALISDAGTPGISDPGYLLIKTAIENGVQVTSIPGASAVINALAMSGLPTHRFLYLGYLPLKKGRKRLIASFKDYPYTVVLYEAPHRILRTLQEILDGLGDRHVSVCREMTKFMKKFLEEI